MQTRSEARAQPFTRYDETGLQELLNEYDARMQRLNDQYLRMMGEHIAEIGTMIPSDVHRLQQIRRMNKNLSAIERRIAAAAGMSVKDIRQIFEQTVQEDVRMAQKILGVPDTVRVSDNLPLQRILRAQVRETAGRMQNLSNTTVVSKPYRNAVDEAVIAVQSGVEDYGSAIRRSIREAGQYGLRVREDGSKVVDYESGYSRRLDTAVRMNILDGIRHLNQSIMEEVGRQFGADGIEIDAHMLCAEDHLPYQGGQYSNEDFEEIQASLPRPFGEWNCRHSWHPILLGISEPTYTQDQLQEMRDYSTEEIEIDGRTKTRYEWSQEMRRCEVAIRQQKDAATLAKAAGDAQLERRCKGTVLQLNEKYKSVADQAGLKPEFQRTFVQGYRDGKTRKTGTRFETGNGMLSLGPKFSISSKSTTGQFDPETYKEDLTQRFEKGSDTAKKVYERFVPEGGAVSDGDYKGDPHFDSGLNSIKMSFDEDAKNILGSGVTWFHEHGHFIDHAAGEISMNSEFLKALYYDARRLERKVKKEYNYSDIEEARYQISADLVLRGVDTSSVQDLLGGVIKRPYPGSIAAHNIDYWKDEGEAGLCREAFAHMFEACFDAERGAMMKRYFPTAWTRFQKILGGLVA